MAIIVAITASMGCLESPENIVVGIQSPSFVNETEEFNIIVTIENTAEKPQKIMNLVIADGYLEGISIINSEPQYTITHHLSMSNAQLYDYNIEIPSGGKQIIKFTAVALKKGDYSGDIAIFINSKTNFLSNQLRTIVE